MRVLLSILFLFFGLTAVFLFGTGALVTTGPAGSVAGAAADRALRPFMTADISATVALTIGMAFFAAGVLMAPRSSVWVARTRDGRTPDLNGPVLRYSTDIRTETILELALVFNVLVAAAILVLLCMDMGPASPTRIVGALYVAGILEVAIGVGIVVTLFIRRRRTTPGFRPLLAAAAGASFLEATFMVGILLFGCIG